MLQNVEWGEFKLGSLFEVKSPKKKFDANKVKMVNNGGFPYVVRTSVNNGQKGFIEADKCYLNEENTISFGQDTATVFYQSQPYFTGDKIKILKCKYSRFGRENAHFFTSAIRKTFSSFSWGTQSYNENFLKEQILILPKKNGSIDFDFMENYVSQIESERMNELNLYLRTIESNDFILTNKEQQALDSFYNLEWREFNIIDIFTVRNTKNILSENITPCSGSTPYLCASAENNSVSTYISYDIECLEEGNCIFIGGKTFVVSFQEKDFYSNDSHNLCLYLKENKQRNKLKQLFIATCVNKSLKHKYSWGDSVSKGKIIKDKIKFPCKNGCPDYEVMETLISAIQKLVIKDVILYIRKEKLAGELGV